jgi:hypothetical protein
MKKQNAWRQGDVGIRQIEKIPPSAQEIEHDGVLAYGETTGHKHQLVGGEVKYFRDDRGDLFFEVVSRFVDLNHGSMPTAREQTDGHFAHKLPAGVYRVDHQREYDWQNEILRRVED